MPTLNQIVKDIITQTKFYIMNPKQLVKLGRGISIATIVLGLIHVIATYTPIISGGLQCLSPDALSAMIYMSLICGSAFVLSGLLIFILLKSSIENIFLVTPLLILSGFLVIAGSLAAAYMFANPMAWISLILGVSIFIVVLALNRALK